MNIYIHSYDNPNLSMLCRQMCHLGAYIKANDGLLYPLKSGLLFVTKPVVWLPRTRFEGPSLSHTHILSLSRYAIKNTLTPKKTLYIYIITKAL